MSHTTVGSPVLPSANPNSSPRDTIVLRRRGRKPKVLVALAASTTNTTNGQQQSSEKLSITPMNNQESPALPSPIIPLSPEVVKVLQSMNEPLREKAREIAEKLHQEKIYTVMNRYEIGSLVAHVLKHQDVYGQDAIYKLSKVLQLGEKGPAYLYRLATFATYFDRKTVEKYSRMVTQSGKTLTLSHWFLLCAIKEARMRQILLEKAVNEGLSTSDLRFQIKSLLPSSSSSTPATIGTEEDEELGQEEEYADTEEIGGDSGTDFSPEEGEEQSGGEEREGTDQFAAVSAEPKKRGRKKKQPSPLSVGTINKPKAVTKGSRGRKVSVPSDPLAALQKFLDSSERLVKYFDILNKAIDRIQSNLQDKDNTLTPEQKSILKEKLTEVVQKLSNLIDNADYCLPKVSSILSDYLDCPSFSPENEEEEELMEVSGRTEATVEEN
jgi:hypothetical protein